MIILRIIAVESRYLHLVDKPSVDPLVKMSRLQIKGPEPQEGSQKNYDYIEKNSTANKSKECLDAGVTSANLHSDQVNVP